MPSRSRSMSKPNIRKKSRSMRSISGSPSPPRISSRDYRTRSKSGSVSGSRSGSRSRRHVRSRSRRSRSRSYRSRSRSAGNRHHRRRELSSPQRSKANKYEIKMPPGDRELPEPNKCLGVFGLHLSITEEELERAFKKFGHLEKCVLVMDAPSGKNAKSRGFGFVYFEKMEDAEKARDEMNGTQFHGTKIRVDYSITKEAHKPTPGVYFHRGKAYRPGPRSPSPGRYSGSSGRRDRDYHRRSPPPPPRDYYRDYREYDRDYYHDRYYRDRREEDRYYADRYREDRYRDDRYRDYERHAPPPRDYYRGYPPPPPRYESSRDRYYRSPSPGPGPSSSSKRSRRSRSGGRRAYEMERM